MLTFDPNKRCEHECWPEHDRSPEGEGPAARCVLERDHEEDHDYLRQDQERIDKAMMSGGGGVVLVKPKHGPVHRPTTIVTAEQLIACSWRPKVSEDPLRRRLQAIAAKMEAEPCRGWGCEEDIQEHLAGLFPSFMREWRHDKANRFDLFHLDEGIVIEVKVKGGRQRIMRQLLRYADLDEVKGIVIANTRSNLELPSTLRGKPVEQANLWKWGIG